MRIRLRQSRAICLVLTVWIAMPSPATAHADPKHHAKPRPHSTKTDGTTKSVGTGHRAAAAPPPVLPPVHHLTPPPRYASSSRRPVTLRRAYGLTGSSRVAVDARSIRVVDGDTFAYGPQRFRINGFNAPELSEPRGTSARRRLAQILESGDLTIQRKAVDAYGRVVADVLVNGQNVGEWLAREYHGTPQLPGR